MSRWLPHPLISASLVLMWLLLTSFSVGHLVLGSAIALVAGWSVAHLHPAKPRLRHLSAVPRLMAIVAWDIMKSNISVARVLLMGPNHPAYHSGFVELRLRLRDQNALALLAIILTSTPGTAWLEYEAENGRLLLHVLDLRSGDDWQKLIQDRYESLLMEIFE
ncbi:MAG: Na+/H+ antiporter subunit E [Paracoccus sp. (in: a-proteobacteria)]|uniref:Na+/H+ antiporter subunit E n=1 Tax=Paracoccus sp. TaxID=267 RepID=UPI0039E577B6